MMITIRGDFNAKDTEGRIRLNSVESREDIGKLGAKIRTGVKAVIVDDGEGGYEAVGTLELVEGIWCARIVPNTGQVIHRGGTRT
jgi:hypothetical protein